MQNTDFIAYARLYITDLQKEGRYDAANKMRKYVARFISYLGKNEIPFKDFDSLLMRNYHTWLENQSLGQNTVSLYIRNLKHIYRLAVENGTANELHPFEGVDVSYRAKKEKNRLTADELQRLHGLDLSNYNRSVCFARDLFLFSVLTQGMTGADIFRLTTDNIKEGTLIYCQQTTGKEISMRWEPAMQKIVETYAQPDMPYLFPILTATTPYEQWKQHCAALHRINRNLKTIGKLLALPFPLNMTVACHSGKQCLLV